MSRIATTARLADAGTRCLLAPLSAFLALFLLATPTLAQDTANPWVESFPMGNGNTNDTGATDWSTDQPPNGYFATFNNSFLALNTDGEGRWISEAIAISGLVTISVDVGSNTDDADFESDDYLEVCYSVDGGSFNCFASYSGGVNGINQGLSTASPSTSFSASGGSAVVVEIRANNSQSGEIYFWDNVTVSSTSAGSLDGIVYQDADQNDAPSAFEGVGGVTVALFDEACGTIDGSETPLTTVTASDGSYSFSSLADDTYCLDAPPTLPSGALIQRIDTTPKTFTGITREDVAVSGATTAHVEYQNPLELCEATNSAYNAITFDGLPTGTLSLPYNGFPGVTLNSTTAGTYPLAIFDSDNPTGNDDDLGAPNEDFGGPGIGVGGGVRTGSDERFQNQTARGGILVSCEENCSDSDVNDAVAFTNKIFNFDDPTDILNLQFLDVDDGGVVPQVFVYNTSTPAVACEESESTSNQACCDANSDECILYTEGVDCGDNCFQTIAVNSFASSGGETAMRLALAFPGSGGLAGLYFCSGGDLPVELTSFEPVLDGQDVLLSWTTASETNNAGFEIQMAESGPAAKGTWETLDWADGHGTTLEAQQYQYRISGLTPGSYRFRLKQMDYDGTSEYSPEVEVQVEMAQPYLIEGLYPNPFNSQAQFRFAIEQRQEVRVELYNALGQRVAMLYEGTPAEGAMQTVTVDGNGLPSGLYLVRVVGESFTDTQRLTLVR